MKHLSVLGIFWLSVWTAPKAAGNDAPGWTFRAVVILWGIYLTWKILRKEKRNA